MIVIKPCILTGDVHMKILCKTQQPTNQMVNRLGKFISKHIDGAKYKQGMNMVDIYFPLYYTIEVSYLDADEGFHLDDTSIDETYDNLVINLNITTYQNKIRVNVIEMTEYERTLGFNSYKPELLDDYNVAKEIILSNVIKRVKKAHPEYTILDYEGYR